MKPLEPSDLFKNLNHIRKELRELKNKAELAVINRDKIWTQINDLKRKSSRLEKLILLLALIQTVSIIIGVT
tara:strand:- start:128 stop:343 length:216 start_codon:yes stop_codon:yes gene_type:complete